MEIQNNTTVAAGAAGLAAGAGAGLAVGTKKANTILGNLKEWVGKSDAYVSSKQDAALEKFMEQGLTKGQIKKFMVKVTEKAKTDLANVTAAAKKTKVKWVAALAAAGLAVGALIGTAASKKAETTEKAQ